jgi:hypothetical protein
MFASTRFATAAAGPNLPRGCGLRHRPVVYVVLASIMRRVVCGQRTTAPRRTTTGRRTTAARMRLINATHTSRGVRCRCHKDEQCAQCNVPAPLRAGRSFGVAAQWSGALPQGMKFVMVVTFR